MSQTIDLKETGLEPEEQKALSDFCSHLIENRDLNVKSVILYGSAARSDYRSGRSDINLLITAEEIRVAGLKSVSDSVADARRCRVSPFFISETNLKGSGDVFPIKFMSMKESYRVLWGKDVLESLEVEREHLRLRCEQETKNLLFRLARNYVMGGNRWNLSRIMARSVTGFLENLRVAVSLDQGALPSRAEAVDAAVRVFGLEADVLKRLASLRNREITLSEEETEELYDRFIAMVDIMAHKLDRME